MIVAGLRIAFLWVALFIIKWRGTFIWALTHFLEVGVEGSRTFLHNHPSQSPLNLHPRYHTTTKHKHNIIHWTTCNNNQQQQQLLHTQCLSQNDNMSASCHHIAKDYLQCRMDKGLMAQENLDNLGFKNRMFSLSQSSSSSTPTPTATTSPHLIVIPLPITHPQHNLSWWTNPNTIDSTMWTIVDQISSS